MKVAKRKKRVNEARAPGYGDVVTYDPDPRVSATEFKKHCLALMNRVQRTREEITVTKHGKPVAKLVAAGEPKESMIGYLKGSVLWYGDIISPIDEPWDADA